MSRIKILIDNNLVQYNKFTYINTNFLIFSNKNNLLYHIITITLFYNYFSINSIGYPRTTLN